MSEDTASIDRPKCMPLGDMDLKPFLKMMENSYLHAMKNYATVLTCPSSERQRAEGVLHIRNQTANHLYALRAIEDTLVECETKRLLSDLCHKLDFFYRVSPYMNNGAVKVLDEIYLSYNALEEHLEKTIR